MQLIDFHYARGLSFIEKTKDCKKVMLPRGWWEIFGDETPELRFVVLVLNLTCNSFGVMVRHQGWPLFSLDKDIEATLKKYEKMSDTLRWW